VKNLDDNNSSVNLLKTGTNFILFFMILITVAAWITYGTLRGVIGMISYVFVGLIFVLPWIIPFFGWLLGILGIMGILQDGFYEFTLNLSHLESSWMTISWSWIVSVIALTIGLILTVFLIFWLKGLMKYRRKAPNKNFALINCNIIDGNRDTDIIKDGVILIKNIVKKGEPSGLIIGVGSSKEVKIPHNYKKVDLKGGYVLPGLINAHCHLIGSGKPSKLMNLSDDVVKKFTKLLKLRLIKWVLTRMMMKNCFNALNAGVTTLRALGDAVYLDVKLRKLIEKGKILGPRLIVAGCPLCITGGHGGLFSIVADSIPEIRKGIRKNLRNEVDCIKIISTGGVMDARKVGEAGRPQMTIEEIETACFEAHRGKLLVATHCESSDGIKEALLGGVDTIEHGAAIPDNLVELFKNNSKSLRGYTALIPTLTAGMGLSTLPIKSTKITQEKFENAKLVEIGLIEGLRKAYKEGIKLGVGTDATVPYSTHYEVWKELKYYLKYTNMTAQEAIYFATKGNAEILGISDITGSIEVGKYADLQVVPGNPLENIDFLGKVVKVMIRGYLINKPKVKKIKGLQKIVPIEV